MKTNRRKFIAGLLGVGTVGAAVVLTDEKLAPFQYKPPVPTNK